MLKEIGHFLIHTPATLALKRKCPRAELYDLLMKRRTETLLEQQGFDLREVQPFKVFAPGLPAFPMRWIRSVPL
ncbi:MAG: hypothetical protein ACE5HO_06445 [bacterium]